jgi:hypothetical protein
MGGQQLQQLLIGDVVRVATRQLGAQCRTGRPLADPV